ncbi:MAG: response regulator transcription factor [Caulobacteraceae bacterium]
MTTNILVADDHPLFRDALKIAVSRIAPHAELVEACTLSQALQHLETTPTISLVLLDLRMPDCAGVESLLAVRARFPLTPVVIVSACEDRQQIRKILALGASGFIPKSASMEALGSALESILAGDVFAPLDAAELAETEPALERLGTLTPAQLRILMDLQRGRLNKQIAFDVGVTEATVKSHLTAIFRKLGVVNRTQAVLAVQSLMEDAA